MKNKAKILMSACIMSLAIGGTSAMASSAV